MFKYACLLVLTFTVSACTEISAPTSPPALTEAPPVASSGFLTAYAEETVPLTVPELRTFLKKKPLIDFLEPTENISNPVSSKVLKGKWPNPGAARWLKLADGHYVIERVLENKLDFFKYQVFVFTNEAGRGVEQIVGEQRFVKVSGGTQFQWSYNVLPKNVITRKIVKGTMDEVKEFISGGLQKFAAAAKSNTTR